MPDRDAHCSGSIARHLARGAVGFGLIGSALASAPSVGVGALLLAPLGMVALRGCPACWTARLVEIVAAGRRTSDCESCAARSASGSDVGDLAVRRARARN